MTDSNTDFSVPIARYHSAPDCATYYLMPDGQTIVVPDENAHALQFESSSNSVGCFPAVSIPSESYDPDAIYTGPPWLYSPDLDNFVEQYVASMKIKIIKDALKEWRRLVNNEEFQDSPELSAFLDSFQRKGGNADGG